MIHTLSPTRGSYQDKRARPGNIPKSMFFWKSEGYWIKRVLSLFQSPSRAMAPAVNHKPLTAETRVRSQASLSRTICGGESGNGKRLSPSTSVSRISIIPLLLHTHLYLHVALTRRIHGRNLGHLKKNTLSSTGEHWIEKYFHLFLSLLKVN
jgi:hypothetical protein